MFEDIDIKAIKQELRNFSKNYIKNFNKIEKFVKTEIDEILDNTELELCLSDGERSILSGTKLSNYGDYSSLVLDRTEYLEGVVSVSEPFELKVNGDIQEDDKRAIIGSTLDISKDAEDLVEPWSVGFDLLIKVKTNLTFIQLVLAFLLVHHMCIYYF